jgi:hypothetical protein
MNNKVKEALGLLREECAEVIVETSKCDRFGLDSEHYKTGLKHSTMLEMEIGDVLCLVDFLLEQGILDQGRLDVAKENKKNKLKQWSTIYS